MTNFGSLARAPWHPTRSAPMTSCLHGTQQETPWKYYCICLIATNVRENKSHLVLQKTWWFNGLIMGWSTMFKLVQDWTAKQRWNVVFLMWVFAIICSASCLQLETQTTSVKVTASKTHPYHQTSFASLPSFDVNSNRVFQGDESGMWSQTSSEYGRFWYQSVEHVQYAKSWFLKVTNELKLQVPCFDKMCWSCPLPPAVQIDTETKERQDLSSHLCTEQLDKSYIWIMS